MTIPASSHRLALVVDDEEPVRRFVDRALREGGYRTVLAEGGAEAMDAVDATGGFDILVTDLMMPDMPGDELARRLRLRDPLLKVLYLTGFTDRLFEDRSRLSDDEAYLEKPCSVRGLLEAMSLLMTGRIEIPAHLQ